MSAVPDLFRKKQLPLHAALIQTSPPDDFGWMSLGISVDVGFAAAYSADIVIAQLNPQMPRVLGHSFIHVNDVDYSVEKDEPLLTIADIPEFESAHKIARLVANLIEDGSTFQLGLGATPKAILLALSDKNDLGCTPSLSSTASWTWSPGGSLRTATRGSTRGKPWPATPWVCETSMILSMTTPPWSFSRLITSTIPE